MSSYYSSWYKNTINNGKNGRRSMNISAALEADLTPAQVTVSTIQDKFVYNMEYKPTPVVETNNNNTGRHIRQSSVSSSSSTSSNDSNFSDSSRFSNTSNTFAAANVMAARFQNRSRNRTHSGGHSRQFSTESAASFISEETIWDDWIVKYIEDKKTVTVDDAPMEDWIFETM